MAALGSANRGCTWACWPGSAGRCCAPQSMGLSCKAAAQPATTQASGPAVKMDGANSPAQCVPESKAPSAASAVTGKAPGPRAATPAEPSEGTLGVDAGSSSREAPSAQMPSCVFPGSRARWSQHQLGQDRLQRLNLEGPSPSEGHVGIKLTVSDLNLSFEHVNTITAASPRCKTSVAR